LTAGGTPAVERITRNVLDRLGGQPPVGQTGRDGRSQVSSGIGG
jgi:hypothetical protein